MALISMASSELSRTRTLLFPGARERWDFFFFELFNRKDPMKDFQKE